jgi:hypothetical protein
MFKRVVWMGTGMTVGAAGAFWAKHKVEQTVERYLPEQVVARVGSSSRDLGRTLRSAASEGRDAMRATEAELRARVEARTFIGPGRADAPKAEPTTRPEPAGHTPAKRSVGSRRASRVPAANATPAPGRRRARR